MMAHRLETRMGWVRALSYAERKARAQGKTDVADVYKKYHGMLAKKARRDLKLEREALTTKGHMDEARLLHAMRSTHAQRIDESIEATRKPDTTEEWSRSMNRSDIKGIDFFPIPMSTELKDNFEVNNQLMRSAWEDHYNIRLPPILKFVKTKSKGINYYAQHHTYIETDRKTGKLKILKDEIRFSIPAYKVLERGTLETIHDFQAFQSIAHELGHAYRGHILHTRFGEKPHPYLHSSGRIEEGSTDISATRFALHNFQMDSKMRKEIVDNISTFIAYKSEAEDVGDIALLMAEGDEKRAVEWIDQLRTEHHHNNFMVASFKETEAGRKRVKEGMEDWKLLNTITTRRYVERILMEEYNVKPTRNRKVSASRAKDNVYWMILV